MAVDQAQIDNLLRSPSESLSTEVKTWIDLDDPDGQANLVRTALALRNHNGGFLIIGFDDKTMLPDEANRPQDIKVSYHSDKVQGLISKYASEIFDVRVEFGKREGHDFPVIIIPDGIKTPVAAKQDLLRDKKGILTNDVYVRTLRTNHKPSTSKASHRDWPDLIQRCFDNREANIGQFIRRQLSGLNPDLIKDLTSSLAERFLPEPTDEANAISFLDESEEHYQRMADKRGLHFPPHGTWEVALVIQGDTPALKPSSFLDLIARHNPQYSGWPVWLDPRIMGPEHPPVIIGDIWEALMVAPLSNDQLDNSLDYMRLDPKGRFFLRRALDDDTHFNRIGLEPMKAFDVMIPIDRTAEAIAVGIAFAKGMGYAPTQTNLSYLFKWSGLENRSLISWATPGMMFRGNYKAHQDEVQSFIQVPLDLPISAIGPHVHTVLEKLYDAFGGFQQPEKYITNVVTKSLSRTFAP